MAVRAGNRGERVGLHLAALYAGLAQDPGDDLPLGEEIAVVNFEVFRLPQGIFSMTDPWLFCWIVWGARLVPNR